RLELLRRFMMIPGQDLFVLNRVELAVVLEVGVLHDGVPQLVGRDNDAHLTRSLHPQTAFNELVDRLLLELVLRDIGGDRPFLFRVSVPSGQYLIGSELPTS